MNCTLNLTESVSELPMPKTQRVAMPKTQKVSEPKTRIVNELKTAENAKLNQSLNQLFETHKDALAGFMRKRIGDSAIADDLLHDLYIKLQSLNIDEIKYPKAYLYRMANNLIIDEQRKQSRFVDRDIESHHGENEIVEDRSPEAILNQSQRLSTVTKALQELPEKTRDVFCLLRLKQLEKQEVASHLGISVNMVEKHVRKAIEYCQNKLKKSEL